ncbi:MAG: hypothetical protein EZS28_027590 [Streblomastix strix]|uniref:Uncharacterized protein n=1 Tax=Streblomastix strix TaxID=222440 RepID=A0A5J4V3C0_9EUKA|nr:MAG: hypothetical protein EZS28_027590 [Streblomastix strix]
MLKVDSKKELISENPSLKQFQLQLSESERKLVESEERLRIAESEKQEVERKWIQAELGKRDAEDKAGIAEQIMKDAEEQIVLIESKKKKEEQKRIKFKEKQKDWKQNLNNSVLKLKQVEQETEDILLYINGGFKTIEIKNAECIQMKDDLDAEEKVENENVEEIRQKKVQILQKIIAQFIEKKNNIDFKKISD